MHRFFYKSLLYSLVLEDKSNAANVVARHSSNVTYTQTHLNNDLK